MEKIWSRIEIQVGNKENLSPIIGLSIGATKVSKNQANTLSLQSTSCISKKPFNTN